MNAVLPCPAKRGTVFQPLLVVFCAGLNLVLIQWILVRELTALLLGTEIVTLLVSVSYFAGLSLGYRLAGCIQRIDGRWMRWMAMLTLASHLSLPIWFRLLAAFFAASSNYGASLFLLPLLTPFAVSLFYSVLLPSLADSGQASLSSLYAAELTGSGSGILMLVGMGGAGLLPVMLVYVVMFVLIAYQLRIPWRALTIVGMLAALWLVTLGTLDTWSNDHWYRYIHNLPTDARTVFSAYSPYQKIDVLEIAPDQRMLFLDGQLHFGDVQASRLNTFLGEIPAALSQPDFALVIGAGSMEMERQISAHAGHVRTVEIDPLVVSVSLRYFDYANLMSRLSNRSIIIDDAKHYLATSRETYDLVSTDTPAPHSLQTASLYSVPFYESIAAHLRPQGLLAANLTSTFAPDDEISRRVAASLLLAFEQVIVVTPRSAEWSFAYAGNPLPFDSRQIAEALRASDEAEFLVYDTRAVQMIVGDATPINFDTLDIALTVSLDRISGRLER